MALSDFAWQNSTLSLSLPLAKSQHGFLGLVGVDLAGREQAALSDTCLPPHVHSAGLVAV